MLPKILALQTDANYLHRLTPLFGISALGGSLPVDAIRRQFMPALLTLSKDPVANVRMNVSKSIQILVPITKAQPDLLVSTFLSVHHKLNLTIGTIQRHPDRSRAGCGCRRQVFRKTGIEHAELVMKSSDSFRRHSVSFC